jgi:chromatin segregation and condensation protein Rec8/ScpA/Scc1 (kleisin family)
LTAFVFRQTTSKENVQPQKSKAKTTHQLLTAYDVLAEKRELLKRKEQKQLKSLRKTKRRNKHPSRLYGHYLNFLRTNTLLALSMEIF